SQTTFFVRWVGRSAGLPFLATADLTLWRWFFFGLGLAVVMLLKPEGLVGRPVRPATPDDDELAVAEEPPAPRVEAVPVWLRERTASAADARSALLEVQGMSKHFGG